MNIQTKIGGVPAWAWGAAGAVGIAGWFFFKRKGPQKATTSTTPTSSDTSTLGGTFPSAVPIIIPSATPGNTGLPADNSQSGTSTTTGGGTAVPPAPSPSPILSPSPNQNPLLLGGGGGWPYFVAGGVPESQLVWDGFMHYLGRAPGSQAEMSANMGDIARNGYGQWRQKLMLSPEAQAFAASHQVAP